jgi:leader peptidase (prepilin peptidase) / N-methyltransferase
MTLVQLTVLAGILGLVFGSFLNVCVSRWPEDESILKPRSYCENCKRTLSWWENIPVLGWLVLRGRCRTCQARIGWRHLVVELAVGGLWAYTAWRALTSTDQRSFAALSYTAMLDAVAQMVFFWLLVGLAALDAENLWLPDRLTFPGILLGFLLSLAHPALDTYYISGGFDEWKHRTGISLAHWFLAIVIPTGVILAIRHLYRVLRNRDGIGAGDAKLMAMLGGWLGAIDLRVLLLAFGIGVVLAALYGLLLYANPTMRGDGDTWLEEKLPFGTFLSLGGIVGGLWGAPIVAAYMRLAGA